MSNTNEITYALLRVKDAQQMIAYLYQVWKETPFLTRGENECVLTIHSQEEKIRKISENPYQMAWCASCNGEIVGILQLTSFEQIRLRHRAGLGITVKQAYWGQHIGSHMMEIAIQYAQTHGITCIELEVSKENKAGIALYKKYGFKKFGEYDKFMKLNGTYVGAYYMYKDIPMKEESI